MKMPSHTSVNLKKQIKQISNVKTRGKSFTENAPDHRLRTPNEGINQRYLKTWADVADKRCCRHT